MRVLDTVPFIYSLVVKAGRIRPARHPYLSIKKQLPAAVEVVIDQGSKVTAYGGRRIVKRGQEVCADIPNLCRVLPQAAYHILDMFRVQLEQPASYNLLWEVLAPNAYHFSSAAYRVYQDFQNFIQYVPVIAEFLAKMVILDILFKISR